MLILMRTPYGRREDFGQTLPAEQGYAVLVQDTRGRFGSDGQFVPVETEIEDGAVTIEWLRQQEWYSGRLAVFGISYLGFTAWACAGGRAHSEVRVLVPVISQSRVRSAVFLPGGAVALELVVLWLYLVLRLLNNVKSPWHFVCNVVRARWEGLPSSAMHHLPIGELDEVLLGQRQARDHSLLIHPG